MKKQTSRAVRFALMLFLLAASGSVFAQANRTWVSGVGDDANPCSRTAPCKTFAGAISKTAAGGTIGVLDPGGYGAVTITKAITLDGNGYVASILHSGTNGITINAGVSDVIVIRNLALTGAPGTGLNGIRFLAGGALHVQNVSMEGTTTTGISFEPSGASELTVIGGTITRTGVGVLLKPSGVGTALATLDGVTIVGNTAGVRAEAGVMASIRNAVISDNANSGVGAVSTTGVSQVTVSDSLLSGNNPSADINSAAIKVNGTSATINIDGNSIVHNGIGLKTAIGGTIQSTGRNHVAGNTDNGAPTATVPTI